MSLDSEDVCCTHPRTHLRTRVHCAGAPPQMETLVGVIFMLAAALFFATLSHAIYIRVTCRPHPTLPMNTPIRMYTPRCMPKDMKHM